MEYEIAKRDLAIWMNRFEKIIFPRGLKAEYYGSFATGLWTKNSNIDIMVIPDSPQVTISLSLIESLCE